MGRIKVHDVDMYVEVAQAGEVVEKKRVRKEEVGRQDIKKMAAENAAVKKQIREAAILAQTEAIRKDIEKKVKEEREQKELDFQRRLENLFKENEDIMESTATYMSNTEVREARKRDMLHHEWSSKVFYPIQDAITEQVESEKSSTVEKRRRDQFQAFLNESNTKMGVFRDIIVESDYDPLQLRDSCKKKVSFNGALNDPTHRATSALNTFNARPSFRTTLDVKLWNQVEATPHGRYSNKPPSNTKPARPPTVPGVFDHFCAPLDPCAHKSVLVTESGSKGKGMPHLKAQQAC